MNFWVGKLHRSKKPHPANFMQMYCVMTYGKIATKRSALMELWIDLNRKNNVFDNLLWVTEKEHDEIHNLLKSVNNDINNPEYRKRIKEIQEANSYPDGVEPSRVIHHLDYKDSPNCYMYVTPKSYEKYLETENENDLVIIGESHF